MGSNERSDLVNDKLTEIICVIDRSGSMGAIRSDAIGSFNTFLADQKKLPDDAIMTVVLFDETYEILHNGVDIKNVPEFDDKSYTPRGMTALLDAVGKTINDVKTRISATTNGKLIPGRVLMVILTDGQENSSREFTLLQIFDLIKDQKEKDNWEFIYLSADPNAFADARALGIGKDNTISFAASGRGIRSASKSMSNASMLYRSTKKIGRNWKLN